MIENTQKSIEVSVPVRNVMMEDDASYYSELHAALRGYDTKLWAIPSIFITLSGAIFGHLDFKDFQATSNLFTLSLGLIFEVLLLLVFYKTHFYHISNQKKINEIDSVYNSNFNNKIKRIPTESMTAIELDSRLIELESDSKNGVLFSYLYKLIIRKRVSFWTIFVMWFTVLITGAIILLIFYGVFGNNLIESFHE
jgi:hypothetical protein